MRRIEITKHNEIAHYEFPTSWEEITVEQYAGLFDIPKDLLQLESVAWLMNYFTNISQEDLYAMQMSEIARIEAELAFVYTTSPSIATESVEAGGWRWRRRSSWDNITYGEVVSLQTIGETNTLKALPKLLCILLERFDEQGNAIPFDTSALNAEKDFAKLPITSVMGVLENFHAGIRG